MSHFSDNAYNIFEYKEKRMTTHSSILGEFSGQRSLLSCSPWGHKELETTGGLTHTHKGTYF